MMPSKITIRIDPEIRKRFSKVVEAEGRTPDQAVRELIEN
jgi:antitoxin component of RelBE/YafQ-DinJ toxin-antitoxin module